jgi:hypothetical protein
MGAHETGERLEVLVGEPAGDGPGGRAVNSMVGTASRTAQCVRYERSTCGRKSIQHSAQNVSMLAGNPLRRTAAA